MVMTMMMVMMMAVTSMTMTVMHASVFWIVLHARALHVMVMAHLRGAVIVFVADDLFAILTQLAIHIADAVQRFFEARDESIDHTGMVVQV